MAYSVLTTLTGRPRVASLHPSSHPAPPFVNKPSIRPPSGLHLPVTRMLGWQAWCASDDGASSRSPIDADNDFDAILDGWDAVEAVKVERGGDFALSLGMGRYGAVLRVWVALF